MRTTILRIPVMLGGILLFVASGAQAIDKCKVSIDRTSGVLLVSASGVSGTLLWGETHGGETSPLFNAAACIADGKAKKCEIADPATLAAKTPPPGCTLYLDDDGTPCSVWIRGCTPGARDTTVSPSPGGLVLVDATGAVVGSVIDDEYVAVYRQFGSLTVKIWVLTDGAGFESYQGLEYAAQDCTGVPLVWDTGEMYRASTIVGDSLYYATAPGGYTAYQSELTNSPSLGDQADCDAWVPGSTWISTPPTGCCMNVADAFGYLAPAVATDAGAIAVPPFHLEVH